MNQDISQNDEEKRLRLQLQRAVNEVPVPPYLEAKIRAHRHAGQHAASWIARFSPALAALVVIFGAGIAYRVSQRSNPSDSQSAYIASVTSSVSSMMRVGLGDHVHCALFRDYPKQQPALAEVAKDLPEDYRPLIPIVAAKLPNGFCVQMAHECEADGRNFVHLILKSDRQLVSVVLAVKSNGESFDKDSLIPALSQSGISFYRSSADKFEIASFESRKHLIYVISDMPGDRNMNLMLALAPELTTYLKKLES